MANRKASIIKETLNKVDALQSCESTCHECTSTDTLEHYKEDVVVAKEELIMKKDVKNKEIMREKKQGNKKKVFHSMKAIYEKAIEVNNELKVNVDE